jgi:hypothetical protein
MHFPLKTLRTRQQQQQHRHIYIQYFLQSQNVPIPFNTHTILLFSNNPIQDPNTIPSKNNHSSLPQDKRAIC